MKMDNSAFSQHPEHDSFVAAIDALDALICVIDLETYELLFVNKAGKDTYGAQTGSPCWESFHPGSTGPCKFCSHDKMLDEDGNPNSTYEWEYHDLDTDEWFQCRDKAIRWHDDRMVKIAISTNITRQKQFELELQENNKQYQSFYNMIRLMTDNMPNLLWAKDMNKSYIFANKAICDSLLMAKNTDEPIGKNDVYFAKRERAIYPDKKNWHTFGELCQDSDDIVMSTQKIGRFDEYGFVKGKFLQLDVLKAPILDEHGKMLGTVGCGRDVTKENELEEQLRQSSKMVAIGTLAGGIAHDFNNILGIILSYAEIARDEVGDSQLCSDLEKIVNATKRGTDLVKHILTFSRQDNQVLKPLRLQPVIKELLKMLRRSLPSTIILQEEIAQKSGVVLADPIQINQILMNLCTNARDAMTEQTGILKVSLTGIDLAEQQAGTHLHPELKKIQYNLLEVKDNGCGIDPADMERIFEPFFTTKEQGRGTGLGLSITYGIIQKHGGVITIDSEPDQGTTCRVYLPTIIDNGQKKQAAALSLPTGHERIMLVDDEVELVKTQQRILQNLGYSTTSFHNSIKALEAFLHDPNYFDLVITDMTMPELSGMILAERLKKVRPNLPVILCTGFSEIIDESQALAQGIAYYLSKPILKKDLAMAVRQVLDKAQE